jgi:hypothetical protein
VAQSSEHGERAAVNAKRKGTRNEHRSLKGLLESLGPQRRARELPTLAAYLASKSTPVTEANQSPSDEQAEPPRRDQSDAPKVKAE